MQRSVRYNTLTCIAMCLPEGCYSSGGGGRRRGDRGDEGMGEDAFRVHSHVGLKFYLIRFGTGTPPTMSLLLLLFAYTLYPFDMILRSRPCALHLYHLFRADSTYIYRLLSLI